jgi:hypothetical protein
MTTKVVNDSYPLSDEALKAQLAEEFMTNGSQNANYNGPTEVIDLPSKGYFYPEGHPLSSGKIELKYMTAKEEDILSSQNLIKQGVVIDKLLQSLIVTKVKYDDILTADKNAIFIAARVLAYGADYETKITCPKCGTTSNYTIDLQSFESKELDWDSLERGKHTLTFTLPVGKQELEIKFLTHGDEKELEKALEKNAKQAALTGINNELTTRLKRIVVSVNGSTDPSLISQTVDNMLSRDSLALRQFLKAMTPDLDTSFSFACNNPGCDYKVEKMQLPITTQFFWPGV